MLFALSGESEDELALSDPGHRTAHLRAARGGCCRYPHVSTAAEQLAASILPPGGALSGDREPHGVTTDDT